MQVDVACDIDLNGNLQGDSESAAVLEDVKRDPGREVELPDCASESP